jgi:hypothetical protein
MIMALETTIYTKDTKQAGAVHVVTRGTTPQQAVLRYLQDLGRMGYPLRNTITELIRELVILKAEMDFKVNLHGKKTASTIRTNRGGATGMASNKARLTRPANSRKGSASKISR